MSKFFWFRSMIHFSAVAAIVGCGVQPAPPPPAPAPAPPPVVEMPAQKATAGVGKKGKSLADNTGISKMISAPASAFFNFEQKAVLDIQIPQAINLFKATEGRFPKSHEEFMQKIIEANRLALPVLPAGMVYRFDSEKGELWVYPENEVPK